MYLRKIAQTNKCNTHTKYSLVLVFSATIVHLNMQGWRHNATTSSFHIGNCIHYGCNHLIAIMFIMGVNPNIWIQSFSVYENTTQMGLHIPPFHPLHRLLYFWHHCSILVHPIKDEAERFIWKQFCITIAFQLLAMLNSNWVYLEIDLINMWNWL